MNLAHDYTVYIPKWDMRWEVSTEALIIFFEYKVIKWKLDNVSECFRVTGGVTLEECEEIMVRPEAYNGASIYRCEEILEAARLSRILLQRRWCNEYNICVCDGPHKPENRKWWRWNNPNPNKKLDQI